jgi:short subunit dehydrogenase-like uncharacterized protein
MSPPDFAIYGANGYTGELIARESVRRGQRPILCGRNRDRITALASELNCPCRVFPLEDSSTVAGQLSGASSVLHCAGPFSQTAAVMREACVRARASYLDITGEIDVIEAAAECHERARQANISILPAVGMDVVPSDCLASMLAAQLPSATHLILAIHGTGSLSPGTTKTILENVPSGGRVRIDGQLRRVPAAWKVAEIPFPSKPRLAMTIPWGDVSSAYHSTGIPNIEVYMSYRPGHIRWVRRLRWLMPLSGLRPVQTALRGWIERRIRGPSQETMRASPTEFWGRVRDAAGQSVEGTIRTVNGYQLTVETALAAVERTLAGNVPTGFATPSQAFGRDFIREFPDTLVSIGAR